MRKIRISKRHHPAKHWLEPLPLDPRDREIVRAKRSARMSPPARDRRRRSRRAADLDPGASERLCEEEQAERLRWLMGKFRVICRSAR